MTTRRPYSSPIWLDGAAQALGAAVLFGGAIPLSKLLLGQTAPWMLAGQLYMDMGAGVWLHLTERHDHEHTHEPLEHPHYPDAHHLHRH